MTHSRFSTLKHLKTFATVSFCLLWVPNATQANLASLTGGTVSVAHSWTGTPIPGHNGGSNSGSNTHGATFQAVAISSTPGSVANVGAADINQVGNVFVFELNVNWGTTPPVPAGTRTFTLSSTTDEGLSLSSAANWSSNHFNIDPDFPYTVFEIQDISGGGPAIDLLAAPLLSGTLSAGNYKIYAEASGQWSFSGTDFIKRNDMQLSFQAAAVPEPSAFLGVGLIASGIIVRRKSRLMS